jgi:hypothetical protein
MATELGEAQRYDAWFFLERFCYPMHLFVD